MAILSIKFPFQRGSGQFPVPANDDEAIRSSLLQLLSTSKGERPMRPTFGVDSYAFIFDNDSDSSRRGLEAEIRSAISTWEPRVEVSEVSIETDAINEPGMVTATIFYKVIQTGSTGSVTIGGVS